MAQQHLDLLEFPASSSAQLRAGAAKIMRRNAGNAGCVCVGLDQLPDDLFRQDIAAHPVSTMNTPEHTPVFEDGRTGPPVDRDLYPVRHRSSADAPVLANEIHDAPSTITLLDMREREGGDLGPSQSAAQKDRNDGAIAKPL